MELFYAKHQKQAAQTARQVASTDTFLDQNHTHFLLVDDARHDTSSVVSSKTFGLRARLELALREGRTGLHGDSVNAVNNHVPMVLILVQGRVKTFLTVEQSLRQDVPVLVIAVSCILLFIQLCFFT